MRVSQLVLAACTAASQASAGADLILLPGSARCPDLVVPARPPQDTRWIDQASDKPPTTMIPQCSSTVRAGSPVTGDLTTDSPAIARVSAHQIPAPSTAAMIGMVGLLAVRRTR